MPVSYKTHKLVYQFWIGPEAAFSQRLSSQQHLEIIFRDWWTGEVAQHFHLPFIRHQIQGFGSKLGKISRLFQNLLDSTLVFVEQIQVEFQWLSMAHLTKVFFCALSRDF